MFRPKEWETRLRYGVTVNGVDMDKIFSEGKQLLATSLDKLNIEELDSLQNRITHSQNRIGRHDVNMEYIESSLTIVA